MLPAVPINPDLSASVVTHICFVGIVLLYCANSEILLSIVQFVLIDMVHDKTFRAIQKASMHLYGLSVLLPVNISTFAQAPRMPTDSVVIFEVKQK